MSIIIDDLDDNVIDHRRKSDDLCFKHVDIVEVVDDEFTCTTFLKKKKKRAIIIDDFVDEFGVSEFTLPSIKRRRLERRCEGTSAILMIFLDAGAMDCTFAKKLIIEFSSQDDYWAISESYKAFNLFMRRSGMVISKPTLRHVTSSSSLMRWAILDHQFGHGFYVNDTLKHLRRQQGDIVYSSTVMAKAAGYGDLDLVTYLHSNRSDIGDRVPRCKWDVQTCKSAAKNGHLNVLEWIRDRRIHGVNVCSFGKLSGQEVFASACEGGHMNIIRWLRKHHCDWSGSACVSAARAGHLEVLQFLREDGTGPYKDDEDVDFMNGPCPWSKEVLYSAAVGKHEHVIKWLLDKKCPKDKDWRTRYLWRITHE